MGSRLLNQWCFGAAFCHGAAVTPATATASLDATGLVQLSVVGGGDFPFEGSADDDDTDAEEATVASLSAAELDARRQVVWNRTRHLVPFAPARRPASYEALLQHQRGQARSLGHISDGLMAATYAQALCSNMFVGNRSEGDIIHRELGKWVDVWGSDPSCDLDKVDKVITCGHGGSVATYKYTGPFFGCVHTNLTTNSSERFPAWGEVPRSPGIDPSHRAAARVSSILASGPEGQDYPPPMEERKELRSEKAVHELVRQLMARNSTAVAVLWKGRIVEEYAKGISASTPLPGWSLAKSVLSLLIGARNKEGHFPYRPANWYNGSEVSYAEKWVRSLHVESMMNMKIGRPLQEGALNGSTSLLWGATSQADWAHASEARVNAWDDKSFYYSSGTTAMLSRQLRLSFPNTSEGFEEYAAYPWKALFSKIGAKSFACEADAKDGTLFFSAFCYATARDWLRIGELVMHGGVHVPTGEQVVTPQWLNITTTPYLGYENFDEEHSFYTHMWYRIDKMVSGMPVPILAALGTFGQSIIVVPSEELVLVRLGWDDVEMFQGGADPGGAGWLGDFLVKLQRALGKDKRDGYGSVPIKKLYDAVVPVKNLYAPDFFLP